MADAIGFIGLGQMGRPMALNIVRAGHDLVVLDAQEEAVRPLVAAGAQQAADIADLADRCKRIVLCLPDRSAVEAVLFDAPGLAGHMAPGSLVIDCSTTHPDYPPGAVERLLPNGIAYLDAPVSGMQARAEAGTLTAMVGGVPDAFGSATEVLSTFSSTVVHVGPSGAGQLAKTLNNVLFNISCAAMAEILPLAVKLGLDPGRFSDAVTRSSGQSFGFDTFSGLLLDREFGLGYPMSEAEKDMTAVEELIDHAGAPSPMVSAACRVYRLALEQGLGHLNKGAMARIWEQALDVSVTRSNSAAGNEASRGGED